MQSYRTSQFAVFIALAALASAAAPTLAAPIDWTVRGVTSNGTPLLSITDADKLLNGGISSKSDATATFAVINFNEPANPAGGLFPGDSAFPGTSPNQVKNFAAEATATIAIPAAGAYTFGVSSDDGFSLQVGTFKMSYPGLRMPGQTYATFDFAQPGNYPVDLVYFQHNVSAELELFATPGAFTMFKQSGSNFQLVGDSTAGALALSNPGVITPVPEPSGAALLALLVLGLLCRPRRMFPGPPIS